MLPGRRADEVLDDLALDLDEHRDVLGILAWQMGQQPLEVEMPGMLIGFGLQSLLIGHEELTQTIYHLREDVGGNKTIAQHFFSPLCPRGCHLFASLHCPVDTGCWQEAIVITIGYMMEPGSKEERQ